MQDRNGSHKMCSLITQVRETSSQHSRREHVIMAAIGFVSWTEGRHIEFLFDTMLFIVCSKSYSPLGLM